MRLRFSLPVALALLVSASQASATTTKDWLDRATVVKTQLPQYDGVTIPHAITWVSDGIEVFAFVEGRDILLSFVHDEQVLKGYWGYVPALDGPLRIVDARTYVPNCKFDRGQMWLLAWGGSDAAISRLGRTYTNCVKLGFPEATRRLRGTKTHFSSAFGWGEQVLRLASGEELHVLELSPVPYWALRRFDPADVPARSIQSGPIWETEDWIAFTDRQPQSVDDIVRTFLIERHCIPAEIRYEHPGRWIPDFLALVSPDRPFDTAGMVPRRNQQMPASCV
jgi:hypothetical protein